MQKYSLRVFWLVCLLFAQLQSSNCLADTQKDGALEHLIPGVSELPAIDLLTPERADIIAKYIYAKHREWGVSDVFATPLYSEHLRVWNGFFEMNPPKRGFKDFQGRFDRLLDAVKDNTFVPSLSLVPLDTKGHVFNGSHRVAASLFYGKPVFVQNIPALSNIWGLKFFQSRGLAEKYLDAMAIQYCELKPNTYLMTVFPSAVGYNEAVENVITRFAKIVYKKQVFLNSNGGLNLILHAYDGEPFIYAGGKTNYANARNKAESCFPADLVSKNPVRVYLLESENINKMKTCKEMIRNIFKISNHSVHVTDTHEQAILMAKALFNKNSIHCLNFSKNAEFPYATHYFNKYRNWIRSSHQNADWLCVDSGAVLSIYGLRDCNDWDYLHFDEKSSHSGLPGISGHNDALSYHCWDKKRILFDPEYYFYYKGVKFCSLPVVRAMKEKRHEMKDLRDIALINELLTPAHFLKKTRPISQDPCLRKNQKIDRS